MPELLGQLPFFTLPSGGTASGAHTQLGWTVDDLETGVAALKARGVIFEGYDMPSLKTINGVALMVFREGNLLSVAQFV